MAFKPTPEQERIIDAAESGDIRMKIKAGAGSGKTSTLKMVANAMPKTKFLFIAFGRPIKEEAERTFPKNVTCLTSHGMAYRAIGAWRFQKRLKMPRQRGWEQAKMLGIYGPLSIKKGLAPLAPQQTARIVMETVTKFCYSADTEINQWHVPRQPGLEADADHAELAKAIVLFANRAWADILDENGLLRYEHDYYLKQLTLSGQQLDGYDVILLDEAQDSNRCLSDYLDRQQAKVIPVGDSAQAIFAWRGATDAIRRFNGEQFMLSKSFRFGPAIAAGANEWLSTMEGEDLRITGYEAIPSVVTHLDITEADAVICRTNAGTIRKAIEAFDAGLEPAVVGGTSKVDNLAKAAIDLKSGRPTSHPELYPFTSWGMVQDYVEYDHGGGDLRAFVKLVDSIGAEAILEVTANIKDEKYADLKILTGHKAKGLEYDNVLVSDDFKEPAGNNEDAEPKLSIEDARLAYVVATRAKLKYDPGSLNFAHKFDEGGWLKPGFRDGPTRLEQEQEREREAITLADAILKEEERLVEAEVAPAPTVKSRTRKPSDTRHLLKVVPPVAEPAPKSTCTCDPAAAARTRDLTGMECGPDVLHCLRCGGGWKGVAMH